jgi:hypothetical protein
MAWYCAKKAMTWSAAAAVWSTVPGWPGAGWQVMRPRQGKAACSVPP